MSKCYVKVPKGTPDSALFLLTAKCGKRDWKDATDVKRMVTCRACRRALTPRAAKPQKAGRGRR